MHRLFARLALALTLLASPASVCAQDTGAQDTGAQDTGAQDTGAQDTGAQETGQLDEAARLTFESAREAFVAGDYDRALERFRQAYQLSPRPGLLYNIAQTLDRLRRDEETVQALSDYLEAVPDAQNRAEVEARIRVLERSLAENAAARPPTDPTPPPTGGQTERPTEEPSAGGGGLHPAIFIAAAGLALVGGGLAVWAGLETMSLNDAYLANGDPATVAAAYDEAFTYQTMTNVFIGVTAAFGVAAGVLAIFTDWDAFGGGSSDTASLRPILTAGPSGAMVGVGGNL